MPADDGRLAWLEFDKEQGWVVRAEVEFTLAARSSIKAPFESPGIPGAGGGALVRVEAPAGSEVQDARVRADLSTRFRVIP